MRTARDGIVLSVFALVLATSGAAGPDLAREERLRSQIVDTILDGDPIDLQTIDGERFFGIAAEHDPAGQGQGTVIVLHGRGVHPDTLEVVQPLRVGLTERGWNTLSIQLPVLAKQAKYLDYVGIFPAAVPRIDAAIAAAREMSPAGRIVVIAHSCGAHMMQHWMHVRGREAISLLDGFVGIGMGATDLGQKMVEPFALDKVSAPVLDIYAEWDFPAVRRLAPERWAAMQRGGNPLNAQKIVPDAEHYFVDRDGPLVDAIAGWLERLSRR